MALSREFDMSDPNVKYKKSIWDNFVTFYEDVGKRSKLIGKRSRLIKYPDRDFEERGIPKPWQTIAWRGIIMKMGEENFCSLPLELNYLGNEAVLFEKLFTNFFGNHPNPDKLKVTFICGYFWRYNENRRDKMLGFVVDNLLRKGTKVEIWTQDETLAGSFESKIDSSAVRDKLNVKRVKERIDVHYTLIEDENVQENSLLMLEMPHTEAHNLRLETYLTFGKLKNFKCEPKEFMEVLHSYTKQRLFKTLLSGINLALKTV